MKRKTFAAIDLGSYELAMKIFEISPQKGLREIEHIRHRIDLGTESYRSGKLTYENMEELCRVLKEYSKIMETYRVDEYRAYGTSAIRELDNTMIVLDRIEQRTGIRVNVLSNSEQRFLDYKSIAAQGEEFEKIIAHKTAIVDIGGGSIQISLFEKATLVATQNLRLGVLRLYDRIKKISATPGRMKQMLNEFIEEELEVFRKQYLKNSDFEYLILVDDYVSTVTRYLKKGDKRKGFLIASAFDTRLSQLSEKSIREVSKELVISEENVPLFFISAFLVKGVLEITEAKNIWAPGVTLCDGIAYDYAQENRIFSQFHDFEQDIVSCAKSTSKRYQGSKRRSEALEEFALSIFDSTRKIHGLGKRERLLLRISALLYDCGKFVSLSSYGECSYQIIMSTEIIGLSHSEREIVANVVKFNDIDFAYYDDVVQRYGLSKEEYLTVAKLTAVLRLASGLDSRRNARIAQIKCTLHEDELWVQVDTTENIDLERGIFNEKAGFFEEVYSLRPVLKQKRIF